MTAQTSVQALHPARNPFPWRYATILLAVCPIASLLIMPYEIEFTRLNTEPAGKLVWVADEFAFHVESEDGIPQVYGLLDVALTIVTSIVLSFLPIYLGMQLGRTVELAWPPIAGWDSEPGSTSRILRSIRIAVMLGAVAVVLAFALWKMLPGDADAEGRRLVFPHWVLTTLASIGAGVVEEVWLRLGIMTMLVWAATKVTRKRVSIQVANWFGIVGAGVVFGAMHLPSVASLGTLTPVVVTDVILTGLIYGSIFGWLYWRKGLIAAMIAHATQDIFAKVILPNIGIT